MIQNYGGKYKDEQILQQDLDWLEDWPEKWLLKFNVSKSKVMQIGQRNVNYQTMEWLGYCEPERD